MRVLPFDCNACRGKPVIRIAATGVCSFCGAAIFTTLDIPKDPTIPTVYATCDCHTHARVVTEARDLLDGTYSMVNYR